MLIKIGDIQGLEMPTVLIRTILQFLPFHDLCSTSRISQAIKAIVDQILPLHWSYDSSNLSESQWRRLLMRFHAVEELHFDIGDYRLTERVQELFREHIPFAHLKQLSLYCLHSPFSLEGKNFPVLQQLKLYKRNATVSCLRNCAMPNLQKIEIPRGDLTEEELEDFCQKVPSLKEVTFKCENISFQKFLEIIQRHLPDIQSLSISNIGDLSDYPQVSFEEFFDLQKLVLTDIEGDCIWPILPTKIEELEYAGTDEEALVMCEVRASDSLFTKTPLLKKLTLSSIKLSEANLRTIGRAKCLKSLTLSNVSSTVEKTALIGLLEELPCLSSLDISFCISSLSIEAINVLPIAQQITSLFLEESLAGRKDIVLSNFSELKKLILSEAAGQLCLSKKNLLSLPNPAKLTHLHINGSTMTRKKLEDSLAVFHNLQSVSLMNMDLDISIFQRLAILTPHLHTLMLGKMVLRAGELLQLADCKGLQELYIERYENITPEEVISLIKLLPWLNRIGIREATHDSFEDDLYRNEITNLIRREKLDVSLVSVSL